MSFPALIAGKAAVGLVARQLMVLAAIARSARFLRRGRAEPPAAPPWAGRGPTFFVVVPVLREAAVVADAVTYFADLVRDHRAQLVVVTTARENLHPPRTGDAHRDTVAAVEELARRGKFVHLHFPDPHGLKGDQLNYAAAYCAATLLEDEPAAGAFLVCYDVDSRPPIDSLGRFTHAITACPDASVFHQSSRFIARPGAASPRNRLAAWLSHAAGQGAALWANRFVTGFELPRLINRTAAVHPVKRRLCSYVYAHVTGHGLCVRLSLLLALPFPQRSPLEDMHYSFSLGSRNLPMVAVPSLDRAEVPDTVAAQVHQAARWFFGPARALRYLDDPATRPGGRARLLAASALGSAAEWLGCAVVPPAMVVLAFAPGLVRVAACALAMTYVAQLLITDAVVGSPAPLRRRLVRILACPFATVLFGIGGFVGAVRLLRGGSGVGKTERRSPS